MDSCKAIICVFNSFIAPIILVAVVYNVPSLIFASILKRELRTLIELVNASNSWADILEILLFNLIIPSLWSLRFIILDIIRPVYIIYSLN